MDASMITIYTTGPECARCEQLRKWLGNHLGTFIVADMTSPKILAELRTEGIFSLESPILRNRIAIGGISREDWYLAGQLFPDGKLDVELMRTIVGETQ